MKLNTRNDRQSGNQSFAKALRSALSVCVLAAVSMILLPACPDENGQIPNKDLLIELVDGVKVPIPVDYDQLMAAYFSPNERAMISVFPGTTIPNNGLTVEVVNPASLDAALAAMEPEFALEMGPSGTTFNEPVRVSTVIGKTITNDEDETLLPFVDVYTMNNGQPEFIEDVGIEIDEDGLITTHALMPHFSPGAFKILGGVNVKVITPAKNPMAWVGGTIPTKLNVTNVSKNANNRVFVESKTVVRGKLKNAKFKDESYYLDSGKSADVGVGSCDCSGVGFGQIKTTLKVTKYDKKTGKLLKPLVKSRVVTVKCIELNLQMEVYGDPQNNYTDYRVRGDVRDHGDIRGDILNKDIAKRIKIEWDFKGIKCGKAEKSLKTGAFWEHFSCSGEDQELSRIKCKVTYTDDDGKTVTKIYDAPARANEGKKVPF
jgi:hypothetical protein